MEFETIELPREVLVKQKAIDSTGKICRLLRLEGPCLLFTNSNLMEIAGRDVFRNLNSSGYVVNTEMIDGVEKKRMDELVDKARKYSFIVAVGGGKVIDAAKYASFKVGVPFISIPTAPSHDGIASPRATLNTDDGKKISYEARTPIAVIADLNVIAKAPYRLIASGFGDTIANIIAIADWRLAQKEIGETVSEYSCNLSLTCAENVMKFADSIKNREITGIKVLVDALLSSGMAMCITKNSRPASGSEHLFSHAIDYLYPETPATHGEQVGLGTLIMAKLHEMDWQKFKEIMQVVGLPTNAEQIKIPEEILIKSLAYAKEIRKDRYTILNKLDLSESKAKEILKEVNVI
jgi:glycerol-1-phosphate dehydrogenase [NAD(P)+]